MEITSNSSRRAHSILRLIVSALLQKITSWRKGGIGVFKNFAAMLVVWTSVNYEYRFFPEVNLD